MIIQALESRRFLSFATIGSEISVPGSSPATSFDLAVADDGSFIVATVVDTEAQAPDGPSKLIATRYSAAGQVVGEPLTLATGLGQRDVSASIDADGDAVIAYEKDSGIYLILVSKTNAVSTPIAVAAPPASPDDSVVSPSVSMDDNGGFFVAWNTFETAQTRAFDAAGAPRGPALTLASVSVLSILIDPQIASLADGTGAVYTVKEFTEVGNFTRYGRLNATTVLSEPSGDGTISGNSANANTLAVHDDGSFVVGYQRSTPFIDIPTQYDAFAQRVDAQGNKIGDEIALGAALPSLSSGSKRTHRVDVATMPDGGFVASFVQTPLGPLDGTLSRVYVHRYDAAAAPDPDGPVELDLSDAPFETFGAWPTPAIDADDGGIVTVAQFPQTTGPVRLRRLSTDDVFLLDRGALSIFGSGGDDAITVESQGGNIVASRGSTTRTFPAADVQFISINGFGGNDTITNDTELPSTLSGGEGDDTVYGGDADDKIRGEAGRDSLWGREGNDSLFGDDGVDSLYGNGGRDRIDGGANSDHMRGNSGRDKLFGGHGNDRMYGSESADWLYGGIGNDHLYGEGSNDVLDGESGIDTLEGLAGDDVLVSNGDGLIDHLTGGRGRDTAQADQDDLLVGIEATA